MPTLRDLQVLAHQLEGHMQQDPGQRGLVSWACQGDILPATMSLAEGKDIIVTTGFYIPSAGAIETDGPLGAIVLIRALLLLDKTVTLLIDSHAKDIMIAGLGKFAQCVNLVAVNPKHSFDVSSVLQPDSTHVVAVERPGCNEHGQYRNIRGENISLYTAPFDDLLTEAHKHGLVSIGIGDGGNELGMGKVATSVKQYHSTKSGVASDTFAHYCLCAGVSNWAAYAIVALLSARMERNLLPTSSCLLTILNEIVSAGAVDGITCKNTPTVDGLPQSWELSVFSSLQQLVKPYIQAASS